MNRREMLKRSPLAAMTSTKVSVVPGTFTGNTKLTLSGRPYPGGAVWARAIKVTNGPHLRLRLTLTVRVILEALVERHTKDDGHLERSLEGRRILVLLDGNDGLSCDADSVGKVLLRHLPHGPKFSNLIAYSGHQRGLR
jgi:hypothetical protein